MVRRDAVRSSRAVRSAPSISGEPKTHHSVIIVLCSSHVKRVSRSAPKPLPMRPSGSMSQSGKHPGAVCFSQSSHRANMAFTNVQSSQKSSVMRHILAYFA